MFKRFLGLFIIATLLISQSVYADDETSINTEKEIVFVIDRSGSIATKDPNNLTNELVKLYIDSLDSQSTNIGVVGFSDRIVKNVGLTSLATDDDRLKLKKDVEGINVKGSTDIGLALKEATVMLENSENPESEKIIVLISDGETDLSASKVRKIEQSKEDEQYAVKKATENGYKIYSVGVNVSDNKYLNEISNVANGKVYTMNKTSDLVNVFENLSLDGLNKNLTFTDNVVINGVAEDITVDLYNDYVKENNFLIIYDNRLSSISANDVNLTKSNYYSAYKFTDNSVNELSLKMKSNNKTNIKMYYSITTSLKPEILQPQEISNDNYKINVNVLDTNTGSTVDKSYLKNMNATLHVVDEDNINEYDMLETDNGFETTIESKNINNTNIYVTIQDNLSGVNIASAEINLGTANHRPKLKDSIEVKVLLNENVKEVDLDKYFDDIDNDKLSYKISNNGIANGQTLINNVNVKDNKLIFNSVSEGVESITLEVTDNKGGSAVETISLSIMPFWIYYKQTSLIAGLCFIIFLLLFIILIRRKEKNQVRIIKENEADTYIAKSKSYFKGGRMEGYFLTTKSGKDYPALFWTEKHLENKTLITLGELLSFMDVGESIMESRKIFFEATEKGTIIFWHRTKCTVYLNNKEIDEGQQKELFYDDKMYIIFEDGETEIELRYKRVSNKVLI